MNFGLWLTARHQPAVSPRVHFARLGEQVRLARQGRFGMISSGQHHLSPRLQTLPLLAALANEAGEMELATSILQLPLHHPVDVAEEAATMNAILGGRFVLGVGLGHDPLERQVYRVSRGEAAARFAEAARVMRAIWAGEGSSFVGRHFELPEHGGRTAAADSPRVWVGGASRAAIRRAAAEGWAWFPSNLDATSVARGREVFDERIDDEATPQDMPVGLWVHIARSDRQALERAKRAGHGPDQPRAAVVGSPERCIETLRGYPEQAGVTHLLCRIEVPGMDQRDILESIELIATAVIPSLAAHGGP